MFSNTNGLRNTPKTYRECEELWTPRRANKGYCTLAENTTLEYRKAYGDDPGHFAITFYRTVIALIYETHTALFAGGHDSPTTIGRINSFTRARIGVDSSRGYEQNLRINGLPFFDGIRVLPNGQVFPEDVRSDFYTRPKKQVVQDYIKFFNWIKKNLRLRYQLGEFKSGDWDGRTLDLAGLNQMRLRGEDFIPHDMATALLMGYVTGEFEASIAYARDRYRAAFYTMFDGYERIEVPNGNR